MDRKIFKKSKEELAEYLYFKRRGYTIQNKKGKRPYKREKKKGSKYYDDE